MVAILNKIRDSVYYAKCNHESMEQARDCFIFVS